VISELEVKNPTSSSLSQSQPPSSSKVLSFLCKVGIWQSLFNFRPKRRDLVGRRMKRIKEVRQNALGTVSGITPWIRGSLDSFRVFLPSFLSKYALFLSCRNLWRRGVPHLWAENSSALPTRFRLLRHLPPLLESAWFQHFPVPVLPRMHNTTPLFLRFEIKISKIYRVEHGTDIENIHFASCVLSSDLQSSGRRLSTH